MEFKKCIDIINKKGITAYEIHQATGLNEAGVRRILNGDINKPRRRTKEKIIVYVKNLSNTIQYDTSAYESVVEKEELIIPPEKILDVLDILLTKEDELMKYDIYVNWKSRIQAEAELVGAKRIEYALSKKGHKLDLQIKENV